MECPTCFQKIVAPQAPRQTPKFILTGTKVSEKRIFTRGFDPAGPAVPEKKFPAAILTGVILLVLAAGAGLYFFGGDIFHRGLPKGWQTQDIGDVGAPGSASLAKDVFTVSGDGADIWNQADSFRYVFRPLTGDGTLTARVLNIKETDPWAKAGVMIRESLEAGSKFALAVVTPASGFASQQRDRIAGPASSVLIVPNLTAPYWVRLVRQENTFTAYSSENGTEWNKMGSTTIDMDRQAYAGLVVCSHAYGTLSQAQFDNVSLRTNTGAVQPAAPPPPKPVVPPVHNTNSTLTLDAAVISDSPLAGRIHGQDFIAERVKFQDGMLTARWKDDAGAVQKISHDINYARRREFDAFVKPKPESPASTSSPRQTL